MRKVVLAVGLFAATAHSTARADEDIALDYQAPPGCADRAAFVTAVRSRLHGTGRAHRKLRVVLTHGRGYQGKLVSEDDVGHVPSREVSAATCGEVVDALALAAAIALEPEEDDATGPPPPIAIAPTPPPAPSTDARPPPTPAPLARTLDDVVAAFGGGALGALGYTPIVAPGASAYAEAQEHIGSFRLGAAFALSPPVDRGAAGKVSFFWATARTDVCLRGLDYGEFNATACARAELGALQAHANGNGDGAEDTRPWFAVGLATRLRWMSGGAWFLELEPWGVFPMIQNHYVLSPSVPVFDVGPFVGGATLSAGILFFKK